MQIKSGPSFLKSPTNSGWGFYRRTDHADHWCGVPGSRTNLTSTCRVG
ncbi:hypothetical protein OG948_55330 (plasmid) [Embleya sp. NBC_00888]|nr:hypothetical protein OG948_55330 [Embleya sp. NBC_00888]